jgi:hypothetical protein
MKFEMSCDDALGKRSQKHWQASARKLLDRRDSSFARDQRSRDKVLEEHMPRMGSDCSVSMKMRSGRSCIQAMP